MNNTPLDLNNMSITALVDLNQKIQKTLKEKRKERQHQSFSFGNDVKIEVEFASDGKPNYFILKLRQRYNSDSFVTILTSRTAEEFSDRIGLLCSYLEAAGDHVDSYKEE